ncbi:MAG: hypothetical protein GY907_11875 [Bacteroidetes bacterium]|nr:hypothetical protein [Bacteroidota bacterium]
MQVIENNKRIAEFMGYKTYNMRGYLNVVYADNNVRTIKDTHYHSSWDWLMPVVQKIKQTFEGVPQEMFNISLYSDISEVYNAVIEFIEFHNTKKKGE